MLPFKSTDVHLSGKLLDSLWEIQFICCYSMYRHTHKHTSFTNGIKDLMERVPNKCCGPLNKWVTIYRCCCCCCCSWAFVIVLKKKNMAGSGRSKRIWGERIALRSPAQHLQMKPVATENCSLRDSHPYWKVAPIILVATACTLGNVWSDIQLHKCQRSYTRVCTAPPNCDNNAECDKCTSARCRHTFPVNVGIKEKGHTKLMMLLV